MNRHRASMTVLPLVLFVFPFFTITLASADDRWIDQFTNTMVFYQQSDANADWQPYFDKTTTIRKGMAANDEAVVQRAEGELIRMLTAREYGISDTAADDLFQMLTTRDNESLHEMPVSVPEGAINTPYDGGPRCLPGGCDYWRDDVFDAGAG